MLSRSRWAWMLPTCKQKQTKDSIHSFQASPRALMHFKCSPSWWDITRTVTRCSHMALRDSNCWHSTITSWISNHITLRPTANRFSKGRSQARLEAIQIRISTVKATREDIRWISRRIICKIYIIKGIPIWWCWSLIMISFQTLPRVLICLRTQIQRATLTKPGCWMAKGYMRKLNWRTRAKCSQAHFSTSNESWITHQLPTKSKQSSAKRKPWAQLASIWKL